MNSEWRVFGRHPSWTSSCLEQMWATLRVLVEMADQLYAYPSTQRERQGKYTQEGDSTEHLLLLTHCHGNRMSANVGELHCVFIHITAVAVSLYQAMKNGFPLFILSCQCICFLKLISYLILRCYFLYFSSMHLNLHFLLSPVLNFSYTIFVITHIIIYTAKSCDFKSYTLTLCDIDTLSLFVFFFIFFQVIPDFSGMLQFCFLAPFCSAAAVLSSLL